MSIVLFDQHTRASLLPLTAIRHTAELRVGIFSIKEKWERLLKQPVRLSLNAADAKQGETAVPAHLMPTLEDYLQILEACKTGAELPGEFRTITHPWDIFAHNSWAIRSDVYIVMNEKKSALIPGSNRISNEKAVFLEEDVKMEHCIINAEEGPVYVGKNALVMEGTVIRGPVAICENAVVKMGAKLYAGTTIGPNCVAGGEIKNSMLMEYSNKAHDGYLGDSVIGSWCNLGAGTSNSNMKNNAGNASYLFNEESPFPAGVRAGLIMGDFSRCAINTSFNTATIVGVSCNIFGRDFPLKFTPDFTWGDQKYVFEKALSDISNWKALKGMKLTEEETINLQHLYYKSFDNEKTNSGS